MKRMIMRNLAFLPALLLVLSLAACGGSSGGKSMPSGGGDNGAMSSESYDMMMDAPMDAPMSPEGGAGWAEGSGGGMASPALENAKIIYTADMELETRTYDEAAAALDKLVLEAGGYYESRTSYNYGGYRSAHMTVRVPAEKYQDFCNLAGEVAHRVRMSEDTQNVSEAYYDVEVRLSTQRTKLARLQELLAQAENMEDIIALESALSETELQIEYLTGSLRSYDALISFSIVNIDLQEVYKLSSEDEAPMTFSQRLGGAFSTGLRRGINWVEDLLIGVASNWLVLLVWIAVIAAAVTLFRRKRGSLPALRRRKKAEKPEEREKP